MLEVKKITAKTLTAGLITAAVLIYLSGCASGRTDFDGLMSEGYEIRIYEVFGMDCPGCHGGLEKLVNEVPGVKTSKANWEKQRLMVVLHPGAEVDDNAIHDSIKQANFTPGERLR